MLDLPGLRPTTDRVRETAFNWLMPDLPGARCLDAFAGSGALGLESLSRGASYVHFIESNRQAAQNIQDNLQLLDVRQGVSQISCANALALFSQSPAEPFDIVFLDPPFSGELLGDSATLLEQSDWLADNCLIYIEHDAREENLNLPENWQLYRQGKAGRSCYKLCTRSA